MSEIKLPEDFGKAEGNAPVAASNFGRQFEALAYHVEPVKALAGTGRMRQHQ